jgi:hypothetical protein
VPHERLALLQEGMIVFFFEKRWNGWRFFTKCALLLLWFPMVATRLRKAKPKTFWRIPSIWDQDARLRSIPTDDPKLLKIERRQRNRNERKAARQRKATPIKDPDLIDLMARTTDAKPTQEAQPPQEDDEERTS